MEYSDVGENNIYQHNIEFYLYKRISAVIFRITVEIIIKHLLILKRFRSLINFKPFLYHR